MVKKNDNLKNIIVIKNDILDLNILIDKKCLEIQEATESYEHKIQNYKSMMENLILEYHNICIKLYK